MDFENYKTSIKKYLIEDEGIVFLNLNEIVRQNTDVYDNLIILQSRYNKVKRKEIGNLLSPAELSIEYSKISDSLLQFINGLEIKDLIFPEGVIVEKKRVDVETSEESYKKTKVENFVETSDWNNLLKIGNWKYNQEKELIIGSGVFQYILSNQVFGVKPYTIIMNLKFSGFDRFTEKPLDKGNPGIVLGWIENEGKRRYYNLLLTGKRILLEGIGIFGGDEYVDFVHLDSGVEFEILEGSEYEMTLNIGLKRLDLFINNEIIYSVNRPDDMIGKVGIRPWRTKLECSFFEIRER